MKVVLIEPAHVATDMASAQGGNRYEAVKPELMIQPADIAEAALLAFRLGPQATPAEIVVNKLRTPYTGRSRVEGSEPGCPPGLSCETAATPADSWSQAPVPS